LNARRRQPPRDRRSRAGRWCVSPGGGGGPTAGRGAAPPSALIIMGGRVASSPQRHHRRRRRRRRRSSSSSGRRQPVSTQRNETERTEKMNTVAAVSVYGPKSVVETNRDR